MGRKTRTEESTAGTGVKLATFISIGSSAEAREAVAKRAVIAVAGGGGRPGLLLEHKDRQRQAAVPECLFEDGGGAFIRQVADKGRPARPRGGRSLQNPR